jgi:hypothetical protein
MLYKHVGSMVCKAKQQTELYAGRVAAADTCTGKKTARSD